MEKSKKIHDVQYMSSFFIISLILVGALTGCSQENGFETQKTEESLFKNEVGYHINSLKIGMCFDDASEEDTITDENQNIAANNFPILACNRPHDNEVYYIYHLPDAEDYNETEALIERMLDVCEDKFKGYIGKSYQDSYYEMSVLTPTVESWQDGDREAICYAFHPEDKKLHNSLKDINE